MNRNIYVCIKSLEDDYEFMKRIKNLADTVTIHSSPVRPLQNELSEIVKKYEIVICGVFEKFDAIVAENVQRLKILATLSRGIDHIDMDAFEKRGVSIVSLPNSNTKSVAEHTWALILCAYKRLLESNASVIDGKGREGLTERPQELFGKSLGIVGAGSIASEVAKIGVAFGMDVKIWTIHPDRHAEFLRLGASFVDCVEDLLINCDVVSIHIQLSEITNGMISIDLMQKIQRERGLILVNTSREEILEEGLIEYAIQRELIKYCALDVFYPSDVQSIPHGKVIFSPHISGLSVESTFRMRTDLLTMIEALLM